MTTVVELVEWETVSAAAAVLAAIAAAIAAYFSFRQTQAAERATQVQAFHEVFTEIRGQERDFYESLARTGGKSDLDRPFFNTIEYLAYLLRRELLKQRYFRDFYDEAFLYWWQLFERHVPQHVRDDPKQYPEFKRLVQTLRKQSQ